MTPFQQHSMNFIETVVVFNIRIKNICDSVCIKRTTCYQKIRRVLVKIRSVQSYGAQKSISFSIAVGGAVEKTVCSRLNILPAITN